MVRWYERANEASFKLAAGGHVFQAPSPWVFARPKYYLVSEAQKTSILRSLGRWRLLIMIASLLSMLPLVVTLIWPSAIGRLFLPLYLQLGPALSILFLSILIGLSLAPLFAVPQIYLARALRPVLAGAPRSEERIKLTDQLPKIALAASGKLLAVGLVCGFGVLASGVIQMIAAFFEGHLVSAMPAAAVTLIAGGLLTSYFLYLLKLRARARRLAAG
jgi:hypothetical protein